MKQLLVFGKVLGLAACASILLIGQFTAKAGAFSSAGAGTADKPFRIGNCNQLQEINDDLTAHYVLIRDIDCDGVNFTPIGNESTTFSGSLDGRGYTVKNLTISLESSDVGLFGNTFEATISNLGLNQLDITGDQFVGGLAGNTNYTTISNIRILDSDIHAATGTVGGLVGELGGSTITNSSARSLDIISSDQVGGLVGYEVGPSSVSDSYTNGGQVHGTTNVGGLLGELGSGPSLVNHTYASVDILSTGSYVGGLIGYAGPSSGGSINNSFAASPDDSSSDPGTTGGVFGFVNGGTDTGNIWYDKGISGQTNCVGAGSADCTTADSDGTHTDYFVNNHSIAPLDGWDFSSTWRTQATDFPALYELSNLADSDSLPNSGDANGDGHADQFQTNVISVPDFNEVWTTIEIPSGSGCTLDDPAWANPAKLDSGYLRQVTTMAAFDIYCKTPGTTVPVTVIYDKQYDTHGWVLRYYNRTTQKYSTISGAVFGTRVVGGVTKTTAAYSATDGGAADSDGMPNGKIEDPVAPALATASISAPNTGFGESASNTIPAVLLITGVIFMAIAWISNRKSNRRNVTIS